MFSMKNFHFLNLHSNFRDLFEKKIKTTKYVRLFIYLAKR